MHPLENLFEKDESISCNEGISFFDAIYKKLIFFLTFGTFLSKAIITQVTFIET